MSVEEREKIEKFEEDFKKTFYSLYPFTEITFDGFALKCALEILVKMSYKGKKIIIRTTAFFREILDSEDNSYIIYKTIDEFQHNLLEFRYEESKKVREYDKEYSNYFDKNVMVISGTENEYGECIVLEVE